MVSSVILSPVSLEEHTSLASRLYAASCSGDISQISLLISLGASVNTATKIIGLYEAFKPAKHGHLSPLAGAATHVPTVPVGLVKAPDARRRAAMFIRYETVSL